MPKRKATAAVLTDTLISYSSGWEKRLQQRRNLEALITNLQTNAPEFERYGSYARLEGVLLDLPSISYALHGAGYDVMIQNHKTETTGGNGRKKIVGTFFRIYLTYAWKDKRTSSMACQVA